MSVTIQQLPVGGVNDKRLVLQNAQWAATLDIGTNWNLIRIAARFAFDDFTMDIPSSPRLYLGVIASPSSGFANGPLGNSTNHFLGMRTNASSWAHRTSPSFTEDYYQFTSNSFYAKKVGATVTTQTGLSSSITFGFHPSSNRNAMVVEVEKISSSATDVRVLAQNSASDDTGDVTLDELVGAMGTETLSDVNSYLAALTGNTYVGATLAASFTTDEATDGYWNAICVAWDRSTPACYVSDMLYAKIN